MKMPSANCQQKWDQYKICHTYDFFNTLVSSKRKKKGKKLRRLGAFNKSINDNVIGENECFVWGV